MPAYVKFALRLIILCVLVIGAVLVSEPPSAFACTIPQVTICGDQLDTCLGSCHDNGCVTNCENAYRACLRACGD